MPPGRREDQNPERKLWNWTKNVRWVIGQGQCVWNLCIGSFFGRFFSNKHIFLLKTFEMLLFPLLRSQLWWSRRRFLRARDVDNEKEIVFFWQVVRRLERSEGFNLANNSELACSVANDDYLCQVCYGKLFASAFHYFLNALFWMMILCLCFEHQEIK